MKLYKRHVDDFSERYKYVSFVYLLFSCILISIASTCQMRPSSFAFIAVVSGITVLTESHFGEVSGAAPGSWTLPCLHIPCLLDLIS